MKMQMERKGARPATVDRLLRVQKSLDIILNSDALDDRPEVRNTVVLGINPRSIAVAQSNPPILKSRIDEKIEASFINYDPICGERIRWGWSSRILGLNNEYTAEDAAPGSPPLQAVYIAAPAGGALYSTNLRFDYRLSVTNQDRIFIQTLPCAPGVRLLNFSAGGVQILIPGRIKTQSGATMYLKMAFPWPDKKSRTSIDSRAEVMWAEHQSADNNTRLGLRFQDMDMESRRTFNKIINHYMLAEQRLRKSAA